MPAMVVLLVALAVILGADRARAVGLAAAGVAAAFSLAITIDGAVDPTLQRPDYHAAAQGLGVAARDQVVVTPNLGNKPMALYRPGAERLPAQGWPARQVVLVEPLPRADESSRRPATPPAPPGFVLEGRRDAPTYTLICYGSPVPRQTTAAPLVAIAGAGGPTAQVWPRASSTVGNPALTPSVCAASQTR
jgi:hypothetical protein